MRIVSRDELMKLPAGTVYQQWEPCVLGELMIKGETWETDWLCRSLSADIEYGERHEPSIELDTSFGRDGLFKLEQQYLVYEPADIEIMVAKLTGKPHGQSTLKVE